jgi:PRC-barrel domain
MDGASSVQSLGNLFTTDNNERVGSVDDIIITPEKAVSYAIIGTGGCH